MAHETGHYQDRITQDPEIMVGKPVVRGTRIPVERVLAHLEENDRADLFEAFPELTDGDVRPCLANAGLDRLGHRAIVLLITGRSFRMADRPDSSEVPMPTT